MAVWSIKIVPGAKPNDLATFVPQLQQPAPDGTYPNGLYPDPGDAVSWDNTEGSKPHHPVPTDAKYKPLPIPPADELSATIPAGESSRPDSPCGMPIAPTVLVWTTRRTLARCAASRTLRVPSTLEAYIGAESSTQSR